MYTLIKIVMVFALVFTLAIGYLFFAGEGPGGVKNWVEGNPHMGWQEHIRSYEARMPDSPPGAVPVDGSPFRLPTTAQARAMTSPLGEPSAADLPRGKVYYEYYCVSCHGDRGDGTGPVGDSFDPRPADLSARKIQAYGDGELYLAMLAGVGHANVLEYTVHPEHRWYLVAYVRTFGKSGQAPHAPSPQPGPAGR